MFQFDISTENYGGLQTHVATFLARRVSPAHPNIFITLRYQLVPKTGLFLYRNEDDIKCYFSPHGWDSTTGFNAATYNLQKRIEPDHKTFHFKDHIQVELIDAKVKIGIFDSGVDFSTPRRHEIIKVEGHMNTRGQGGAVCKAV